MRILAAGIDIPLNPLINRIFAEYLIKVDPFYFRKEIAV